MIQISCSIDRGLFGPWLLISVRLSCCCQGFSILWYYLYELFVSNKLILILFKINQYFSRPIYKLRIISLKFLQSFPKNNLFIPMKVSIAGKENKPMKTTIPEYEGGDIEQYMYFSLFIQVNPLHSSKTMRKIWQVRRSRLRQKKTRQNENWPRKT